MANKEGVTLICVKCKDTKHFTFEEANKLKDVQFCEKDGMPMVVHNVKVTK